jgi:hypothetical protein
MQKGAPMGAFRLMQHRHQAEAESRLQQTAAGGFFVFNSLTVA